MHLIKYILCLLAALQLRKIESTKLTAAARETETAPPRTAIYDCPAPLAEQFQNQLDRIHTDALLALGNSKHTAPPQLLDDTPLAPLATKTEQLLNSKAYKLTFKSATLLTCIAPPPPLDEPGLTALTFVKTEHAVKLEFKMKTVKLN